MSVCQENPFQGDIGLALPFFQQPSRLLDLCTALLCVRGDVSVFFPLRILSAGVGAAAGQPHHLLRGPAGHLGRPRSRPAGRAPATSGLGGGSRHAITCYDILTGRNWPVTPVLQPSRLAGTFFSSGRCVCLIEQESFCWACLNSFQPPPGYKLRRTQVPWFPAANTSCRVVQGSGLKCWSIEKRAFPDVSRCVWGIWCT